MDKEIAASAIAVILSCTQDDRQPWGRGSCSALTHFRTFALLFLLLSGCADAARETRVVEAADSVVVVDDAGRRVVLPRPARRVVSLLPAGTETLIALGAGEWVVGKTRYDTHPAVADLPSVGGGLDPSLEALVALRPDLVVAFETVSGSKVRSRLEALGVPVFAMRTQDTTDVFRNFQRLGHLVGRDAAADSLSTALRAELAAVQRAVEGLDRPSVFYIVSLDPPMTAGPATFPIELLGVAGGETIFPKTSTLWPQISVEAVVARDPDIIMLPVSAGPTLSLERLRREPGWRDLRAVREGRVRVVSADLLNRPGPTMGEAAWLMARVLHPGMSSP